MSDSKPTRPEFEDDEALFRIEAIEAHKRRYLGEALLIVPVSLSSISWLLMAAGVIFLIFSVSYPLPKIMQGQGRIGKAIPVEILPTMPSHKFNDALLYQEFLVNEGDEVKAGDPIAVIGPDSGATSLLVNALIESNQAQLTMAEQKEKALLHLKELVAERKKLNDLHARESISLLEEDIQSRASRVRKLSERMEVLLPTLSKGYMTYEQFDALDAEKSRLLSEVLEKKRHLVQLRSELRQASLAFDEELSRLDLEKDAAQGLRMASRVTELEINTVKRTIVLAPVSGRIGFFHSSPGDRVVKDKPLLAIVRDRDPEDIKTATVKVSAASLPFLTVSQKVRLKMTDRLGKDVHLDAEVMRVDKSETMRPLTQISSREIIVHVRIDDSHLEAAGRLAGLPVTILLDAGRQTLFERVIAPFHSGLKTP